MPIGENIEIILKRTLFEGVGHVWALPASHDHSACGWIEIMCPAFRAANPGLVTVIVMTLILLAVTTWYGLKRPSWSGLPAVLIVTGSDGSSTADRARRHFRIVVLMLLLVSGLGLLPRWWSRGP